MFGFIKEMFVVEIGFIGLNAVPLKYVSMTDQ